ncbi:fibronectin type-III domain-containing protein 3A [Amia ocellicauda]|uniref:fibronectin type-III domain-containing protein 3A n=1 Tax=Amia ocellicauda TaxID=2972642 RepID=UPI0034638698
MLSPVMMADQPHCVEAPPMLTEHPLLPHMLSRESVQQVILVQVNPGETFTIRTEDGHIQCIPGPAHVPMVSPNGSMPPIFVPPGYMSQVVEENGMRKVVVLPHSAEFHHSMGPPPSHVPPPYLHPHPAMLHHHHVYRPPVPTTGELPSHFIMPPRHLPQIYREQEAVLAGHVAVLLRDEHSGTVPEHLRKRLKERAHLSPSSSPAPSPHNGHSKTPTHHPPPSHMGSGKDKHTAAASPPRPAERTDSEVEVKTLQEVLSGVSPPTVCSVSPRSAVLSWLSPLDLYNGDTSETPPQSPLSYELALSSGRGSDFKPVYVGEEMTFTVSELRPATSYHIRVCASCGSVKGCPSEPASFTTECSVPDTPAPPRLLTRTKSSLALQWKAPNDNGCKITGYLLEFDEGKPSAFKEIYFGHMKQYKVIRLAPSTKYAFRLAAKNDIGMSAFSEVLTCCTSGCAPPPPAPPRLATAGVSWLALEWSAPGRPQGEESLSYTLEMEEEGSGYGFKPRHNGEELGCTVRNLRRSSSYRFRVLAANAEGRSQPSAAVEFSTSPDRPSPPGQPAIKGRVLPHSLHITWDAPRDSGGSEVTEYWLEMCLGLEGSHWEMVYSGAETEHICDQLTPGTWYRLRVYCQSLGGQSQPSDSLTVQTAAVPPGPCQLLSLAGRARPWEIPLRWGPPTHDGGALVSQFAVEMSDLAKGPRRSLYQGSETECTASRLLPGHVYCFWVKAANQAGWGPLSDMFEASTAPAPPEPCAPIQLTIRTATSVQASWEIPESNGAEVSEFRLEWGAAQGSLQLVYSGPALSHEVRGLVPATSYYCRVQAVNVAGAGLFGEVAMVTTPASVPAAVPLVQEMGEEALPAPLPCPSTCLAVHWEEPCSHGAEITGYNVDFGERHPLSVGRTNYCVLENLQPDTTYRIRVQAVNSVGAGPFSSSLKAQTRPLPPAPPTLECSVSGPQSLKLKWGEGLSRPSALSSTTQYCLQIQDAQGRFVCIYSGPCHKYKVQRLSEATVYHFCIQAHNEAGAGPLSPVYSFSTTKSPPTQLKAPKIQQLEPNVCEVTWEGLQPMRGDPIVYTLQLVRGRESEQLYRGKETWFVLRGAVATSERRVRVCAGRQCQEGSGGTGAGGGGVKELWGQYSPSTALPSPEPQGPTEGGTGAMARQEGPARGGSSKDEHLILLLLLGFAVLAFLFAVLIQYFVIK